MLPSGPARRDGQSRRPLAHRPLAAPETAPTIVVLRRWLSLLMALIATTATATTAAGCRRRAAQDAPAARAPDAKSSRGKLTRLAAPDKEGATKLGLAAQTLEEHPAPQ